MPRALLLLLPLLAAQFASPAEVFVIADTANETIAIAENAKETIAEANNFTLDSNETSAIDSESDDGEIVRKKRTFGDVVFRGIADVLGYNVARKPPQAFVFPPPLAPVPGIDTPLPVNTQVRLDEPLRIPFAVVPVLAAAPAPTPAPAPAPAPPCGAPRAAPPCRAVAPPPPPPPRPTQPPCPRPRANPRPKPRPTPRPPPPPPPPCSQPRANPTTPSPCAPPPPPPKADSNLERISSNFRLDFNFNRAPAAAESAAAQPVAEAVVEDEQVIQDQPQIIPVPIEPRAARLPLDPPRTPRVYLDAFVVQNGVANKVHAVDARNLNQPLADEDYLVYDEEVQQPQQVNDYDYEERTEAIVVNREFGNAVDRFWDQRQKKTKKKAPKILQQNYRNVHFGDRDFANQLRQNGEEQLLHRERPRLNRNTPLPETDDDNEATTTTQDPRRRLKPRVLPPTEHNPNQIDTVTVRVPPIYKEKRPKKLHRERPEEPERPDRDEEPEEVSGYGEREYSFDSDTENTDEVVHTERPKRKRRKKQRRTRSTHEEYTAGDYDYYGNKLPISDAEKYFRGLTIPPPTMDADVIRVEEARGGNGHFLDDHERLRDEKERINEKRKNKNRNKDRERADESERADEKERSNEDKERAGESERSAEDERPDETERTDVLSPNARVRETGYQNNYVHATNVKVEDSQPLVATRVKKKRRKLKAETTA